jgi:AcrR family transcriptional regulator
LTQYLQVCSVVKSFSGRKPKSMNANVITQTRDMSAREKILQTASELFYREGIRAIGVDTIVEKSGVAKTSLYRWFPSKDALIAAFLEDQDRRFWQWWDKVVARHPGAPHEQLRALLAGMVKRLGSPQYRGCPFMNTTVEFADADHPGRVVARANREQMRRRLNGIVSALGAADPARLTDQLVLLINGAYAAAQVVGNLGPQQELIEAAETLIAAKLASAKPSA